MLAMTFGGMLFGLLLPIFPGGAEGLCVFVYVVAAAAMLVPVVKFEFWWVFCAFLLLETMVGMFNSCGATLRSRYYPEGLQSSIMTVFRLPLNLLVVIGTKLTDQATDVPSLQRVFAVIAGMHVAAMLLQVTLHGLQAPPPPVAVVVPAVAAAEAKKAKASKPAAAAAPTPVAGKGAKAASAEKKAAAPKEEAKSSAKSPKSPKSPKSSPKDGKESKKVESADKKGGKSGGKEKGAGGSTPSSKKKRE